ncbi:MAG: HlyC/CorC family transporter [Phycisphaerae bacterium]|nr:HlyC/CorC family transporter [Phycisphaerae bacterium]MBT5409840.1 HlyC/CorC family transporter [Phycisphaerae bacterium]MBT7658237.1 HlyC/CorC family transporter [Phycisphaerae bacterium]
MNLPVETLSWTSIDTILLASLLPLLALSAFFSCSETAFFRLGQAQLVELGHRQTPPAKAALYLSKKRRTVLITILIGNMTANVLYFIVGSVLMLRMEGGIIAELGVAAGTLFSILLFGEVLPKMAATARPIGISILLAPPLLLMHKGIAPIRRSIDFLIITPLARLASSAVPDPLNAEELASLVALSTSEGIINLNEQRALFEVVELSRIRVREVMTPRVKMVAASTTASAREIRDIIAESRLTQLPIYRDDLDEITGMLHTKKFLQRMDDNNSLMQASMTRPQFIPQVATLDQLLSRFRETKTRLAIVVDEFGGTAGLVTLEDILEELVGEIGDQNNEEKEPPKLVSEGTWLLDGNTGVREWVAATGTLIERCPAATMGGLIAATLGKIPSVGDEIQFGNLTLAVSEMDAYRVSKVLVSLETEGDMA